MRTYASEKSLSFRGHSMTNRKKVKYPIKYDQFEIHDGVTNSKFYMFMDILAELIRQSGIVFKSNYYEETREIIDILDNKYMTDKNMYLPNLIISLRFSDFELKQRFEILQKYPIGQIRNIIESASKVKVRSFFRMTYRVGFKYKTFNIAYPQNNVVPQPFFRIIKRENSGFGDPRYKDSITYLIIFDTLLGFAFSYNCIRPDNNYVDYIPINLYEMTDTAQMMYKLIVKPYCWFQKEFSISFIRNKLGLSIETKTIRCILEELKLNKLIYDYHINGRKIVIQEINLDLKPVKPIFETPFDVLEKPNNSIESLKKIDFF